MRLGGGLGALLGAALRASAVACVITGAFVHGWGMFRKHRVQRHLLGPPLRWIQVLHLACSVMLAVLLVHLAGRAAASGILHATFTAASLPPA